MVFPYKTNQTHYSSISDNIRPQSIIIYNSCYFHIYFAQFYVYLCLTIIYFMRSEDFTQNTIQIRNSNSDSAILPEIFLLFICNKKADLQLLIKASFVHVKMPLSVYAEVLSFKTVTFVKALSMDKQEICVYTYV